MVYVKSAYSKIIKMKFFLVYIFFFQTLLYSCDTCQLMTPTVNVSLNLQIDDRNLKNIHVIWKFSDVYTNEILKQYDKNQNEVLDKNELDGLLQAKLDYLVPKNILTKLQYANYDDQVNKDIFVEYKNFELTLSAGNLIFSYNSIVDLDIQNKLNLSIVFEDDESYFNFIVTSVSTNESKLHYLEKINLFSASLFFTNTSLDIKRESVQQAQDEDQQNRKVKKEQNQVSITEFKEQKIAEDENLQVNLLKSTITEIKSLFESIKDEKDPFTYLFLLFFAYVYGFIHALGPGHGKTLVGSYFLSNERSYLKALFISLAIGVVHTFSAFLLTLVIYYVVDTFLAQFIDESIFYTTKISALIIIFIAVYLLNKKYRAYKALSEVSTYQYNMEPHISTCACNSCKVDKNSTDAALIVSAGIIPCPGTITIFIFSLSLGLYYAGFLSALIMSLGMSTVIFFSALLSVAIRKKTLKSHENVKKYLEYISLLIILILGVFLLFFK